MKSIVAAMYETVTIPALIMTTSLPEHFEHASRDSETAGDIDEPVDSTELVDRFAECKPVYEEWPGWQESTVGVTRYEDLPEKARAYLQSRGVYGEVSVDRLSGNRLPYVDNLVNLIVVSDFGEVSTREAHRALCPGGVLMVKQEGRWTRSVRRWSSA